MHIFFGLTKFMMYYCCLPNYKYVQKNAPHFTLLLSNTSKLQEAVR